MKVYNKGYVYGYAATLLLGTLNFGYFCMQYEVIKGIDFQTYRGEKTCVDSGYIGGFIGNLVAGYFVKMGKRKKIIIGNILALVFSIIITIVNITKLNVRNTSEIRNTEFVVLLICRIFYGIGIGMIIISAPFYIKDIAPPEISGRVLVLIGTFIMIGTEFSAIINYIVAHEPIKNRIGNIQEIEQLYDTKYIFIAFFFPVVISAAQLIMLLMFFRHESPRFLYESVLEADALLELEAIYPTVERRSEEYSILKQLSMQAKHCYPTYSMLFTKDYLLPTFVGLGLISLRTITGHYAALVITWAIFGVNGFETYATMVTCFTAILGSIIPFVFVDKFGRRIFLLIGSTAVFLLHVACFLGRITTNNKWTQLEVEIPTVFIIITILAFFYGASNSTVSIIYIVESLPERAFSFVMGLYWIVLSVLTLSYSYNFKEMIIANYERYKTNQKILIATIQSEAETLINGHMIFYTVGAGLMIFLVIFGVKETKGKKVLEINTMFGYNRDSALIPSETRFQ